MIACVNLPCWQKWQYCAVVKYSRLYFGLIIFVRNSNSSFHVYLLTTKSVIFIYEENVTFKLNEKVLCNWLSRHFHYCPCCAFRYCLGPLWTDDALSGIRGHPGECYALTDGAPGLEIVLECAFGIVTIISDSIFIMC